jgi:glutathione S-transferase
LTAEYGRNVNRFHKVPVIHDKDGFKLAESVAIFHYLGRKQIISEKWYPTDVKTLAKIDEFLEWNHTSLMQSAAMIFYKSWRPDIYNPNINHGMMISPKEPTKYVQIDDSLDKMENIWLKDTKFIVGNEPSYAELISSCMLMQIIGLKLFEINKIKYPRVNLWFNETRTFFNPEFDAAHKYIYKYGEALQGKSPFEVDD